MPFNFHLSIRNGALLSLLGFILSAPVAVTIVMIWAPQPVWTSVEIFKANFQLLQTLPYYFGFILVSGVVLLVYAHPPENYTSHRTKNEIHIARSLITIFATLVIFNYICQTSLIPHLVRSNDHLYDSQIALFTMSNPDSLSWLIEMWAYLILAKAFWMLRGCYLDQKNRLPSLLTLNVLLSLVSLVWTLIDPGWVETMLGLVLYFVWNFLMILILVLMFSTNKHPVQSR